MSLKPYICALAALCLTAPAALAIEFSEADINEDQIVTPAEFDDVMPDAGEDRFDRIDADQDRQITETEWNSAMDVGLIPSD